MNKTTYEILSSQIEKNCRELQKIGKDNNIYRLSLLSEQFRATKENIARLLWVDFPELNDSKKIEAITKSTTGMFFHAGIFETDGMRQAFFKRLAKNFFQTEEEVQYFINYSENLYLKNTKTLKEIIREEKNNNTSYKERLEQRKDNFLEVLK